MAKAKKNILLQKILTTEESRVAWAVYIFLANQSTRTANCVTDCTGKTENKYRSGGLVNLGSY